MTERTEIKFIHEPNKGSWVEYNGKHWSKCDNKEAASICAAGMVMQKGTMVHAFLLNQAKVVRQIQALDKAVDKLEHDYERIFVKVNEFLANLKKS